MREKTCCFTGHRIIRSDQLEIVSARTENTIRELITRDGMRCFRVGGAQGYDTMAANILFRLRASKSTCTTTGHTACLTGSSV